VHHQHLAHHPFHLMHQSQGHRQIEVQRHHCS
jgi:hypothetical protein